MVPDTWARNGPWLLALPARQALALLILLAAALALASRLFPSIRAPVADLRSRLRDRLRRGARGVASGGAGSRAALPWTDPAAAAALGVHLLLVIALTAWLVVTMRRFDPVAAFAPSPAPLDWSVAPWLIPLVALALLAMAAVPFFVPAAFVAFLVSTVLLPRYSGGWEVIQRTNVPLALTILAASGWLVASYRARRPLFDPGEPLAWLVFAFAAWSGLGVLLINDPSKPSGLDVAHPPIRILDAVVLFLLASGTLRERAGSLTTAMALAATLLARAVLFPDQIHLDGDLAYWLAVSLPLTCLHLPMVRSPLAAVTMSLLGSLELYVLYRTENRGAAVALGAVLVSLFPLLALARRDLARRRWLALAVALPVLIVAGWLFSLTPYWDRFADYFSGRRGTNVASAESRLKIWHSTVELVLDHPVLGVGWGNFHAAIAGYDRSLSGQSVHNNFLGVLAETGVPGLALYVLLFGQALARMVRRSLTGDEFAWPARAVALALVAYLIAGLFLTRHDMPFAYLLVGWSVAIHAAPLGRPARRPAARPSPGEHLSTSNLAPRRGHLVVAAILMTGLAIYGSLVPLEYRSLPLDDAVRRFRDIRFLELGIQSRSDLVANLLLFVPIGFLWTGAALLDRRRDWTTIAIAAAIVMAGGLVSVGIEFVQLWFPRRTVSLNDILAEWCGAALGGVGWMLGGQRVIEWLRGLFAARTPFARLERWLIIYAAGFFIFSLLPFDVTIRPAEIHEKWKLGRVVLVPFSHLRPGILENLYEFGVEVLLFLPIGMLAALVRTSPPDRRRSLPASLGLGIALAASIELLQVFVYSRFSDVTDLVTGSVGVALGAVAARYLTVENGGALRPETPSARTRIDGRFLAAALGYAALVAAVFWAPFDFTLDPEILKPKVKEFLRVPFQALYVGSDFNTMVQVLRKSLWFAPLGALLAASARHLQPPVRRYVLFILFAFCGAIAGGIELGQLFLPDRLFDLTDVILSWAGAGLGLYFTAHQLVPPPTPPAPPSPSPSRVIYVPPSRPEDVVPLPQRRRF